MSASMAPQPWCCLPWCGHAPGGMDKVRIIDGVRLTYPEGIDAHHPFGRPGPVVYICHECHMAHHDGRRRLRFTFMDGWCAFDGTALVPVAIAAEWDRR